MLSFAQIDDFLPGPPLSTTRKQQVITLASAHKDVAATATLLSQAAAFDMLYNTACVKAFHTDAGLDELKKLHQAGLSTLSAHIGETAAEALLGQTQQHCYTQCQAFFGRHNTHQGNVVAFTAKTRELGITKLKAEPSLCAAILQQPANQHILHNIPVEHSREAIHTFLKSAAAATSPQFKNLTSLAQKLDTVQTLEEAYIRAFVDCTYAHPRQKSVATLLLDTQRHALNLYLRDNGLFYEAETDHLLQQKEQAFTTALSRRSAPAR